MLQDRNINFVGVVRQDIGSYISNVRGNGKNHKGLPTFKADEDMTRGEHEMFYCKQENLMTIKWIGNKPVHIVCTIMTSSVSSAKEA